MNGTFAPKNSICDFINNLVLSKNNGEIKVYESNDSLLDDDNIEAYPNTIQLVQLTNWQPTSWPIKFLNRIKITAFPKIKLSLTLKLVIIKIVNTNTFSA